jgi:hypothetical protein
VLFPASAWRCSGAGFFFSPAGGLRNGLAALIMHLDRSQSRSSSDGVGRDVMVLSLRLAFEEPGIDLQLNVRAIPRSLFFSISTRFALRLARSEETVIPGLDWRRDRGAVRCGVVSRLLYLYRSCKLRSCKLTARSSTMSVGSQKWMPRGSTVHYCGHPLQQADARCCSSAPNGVART